MVDQAHSETDLIIYEVEKRIKREFRQAAEEVKEKLREYMKAFIKKEKTWRKRLESGEITEKEFNNWRYNQILGGKRWGELAEELTAVYQNARETAEVYTAEKLPAVYALNHDFTTYQIEKEAQIDTGYRLIDKKTIETILFDNAESIKDEVAKETAKEIVKETAKEAAEKATKETVKETAKTTEKIKSTLKDKTLPEIVEEMQDPKINASFTLYDEPTVKRLIVDNPDVLPPPGKKVSKAIAEGKAELWDKQQLQSVATQSILQGESIDQIADRLATAVGDSDMKAAVRNARTMYTGAENAGRQAAAERATEKGVNITKVWVATLDMRTRHTHRLLDGQRKPIDKPFTVEGDEIMYPCDLKAKPALIWNCRCAYITQFKGLEKDIRNYDIRSDPRVNGMSYDEWKKSRETWTKEQQQEYNRQRKKDEA